MVKMSKTAIFLCCVYVCVCLHAANLPMHGRHGNTTLVCHMMWLNNRTSHLRSCTCGEDQAPLHSVDLQSSNGITSCLHIVQSHCISTMQAFTQVSNIKLPWPLVNPSGAEGNLHAWPEFYACKMDYSVPYMAK